jgi:S-adenosylmethionine hydrolase
MTTRKRAAVAAMPTVSPTVAMPAPIVTMLSDFGERDGYVGVMRGVMLGICPSARFVDLTHEIPPQDIVAGALVLAAAVPHFPKRTIHVAVVDPGVGSERRPLLIETEDFVLVGPDNGLLSLAAARSRLRRVVVLDRETYHLPERSRTFHGRDIFAPVAAHCANGVTPSEVGSAADTFQRVSIPRPRRLDDGLEAQVIHIDRFGNLVCNVERADLTDFRDSRVSISIGAVTIAEISPHYASVRDGRPLALWNSWDRLEIAVRNGSAARQIRARVGDRVQLKQPR